MTNWESIRIGRLAGITIELHWVSILLMAGTLWISWAYLHSAGLISYHGGLLIVLWGCVLVHELGHGLVAQRFGLSVRRITLLPTGGIVQLETAPSLPSQELLIALAGPLVNLVLAICALGVSAILLPEVFNLTDLVNIQTQIVHLISPSLWGAIVLFIVTNTSLFILNIIPAFPMDGGRILRALLAHMLGYLSATNFIAAISNIIATGLVGLGLIGWPPSQILPNILTAWMGLAIYAGTRQETINTRRQAALTRVEAHQLASTNGETLSPWDEVTIPIAQRLFLREHFMPVVVDRKLVGVVSYKDIYKALEKERLVTIAHVMKPTPPVLDSSATLWVALREMHAKQVTAMPVTESGLFIGMITLQDIENSWRLISF